MLLWSRPDWVWTENRGKKVLTSWETIMHSGNCMLASMFEGTFTCAADEEGFVFIDRDGRLSSDNLLRG